MANLSNINNILRTSSLGVGINCDAEFSLDIEKASANAILSLNSSGGSGAEYVLSSTTSGEFVLNKRYVGDRLTIASGGNATFSGEITSGNDINCPTKIVIGESASAELRLKKTDAGYAKVSWYNNDGSSTQQAYISLDSSEDFVMYSAANNDNIFYAGGVLNLTMSGTNSTFAGSVTTGGNIVVNNVGADKKIAFRRTSANNWSIEHDASQIYFYNETTSKDILLMKNAGQIMLGEYGSGTFTGTTAYTLAVDSNGNIIETTDGGGDITGSGTANTVAKFTGAKAIGDGPITFSGNNSTFAGNIASSGNITATTAGTTTVNSVSTGDWAGMQIQSSDAASAYLFFNDTSGERARLQSTANNDLKFSTNGGGDLALTLDSSKNATFASKVAISTTPHASINLDVLSTAADWAARIKNYTNSGYGLAVDCSGAASSTTYTLAAYSAAGGGLFVRNDDKVGINTTTPQTTLEVDGASSAFNAHFGQGTDNQSGVFGGISLGYSEANTSYRKVGIVAKALADGAARQNLHFLVDTVSDAGSAGLTDTKMMIDGLNGYVGIGNQAPQTPLHVTGGLGETMRVQGSSATGKNYINFADSAGNIDAYIGLGSSTTDKFLIVNFTDEPTQFYQKNGIKMTITNVGKVGIGETAPSTLLSLAGGANEPIITLKCTKNDSSWTIGDKIGGINFFSEDGSGPGAGIRGSINYISTSTSGGATAMTFKVGDNTEKMRIANGGSVGIGTDSPTYKLQVHADNEDILKLHNTTDGLDSLVTFTNPGGTLGRIQGLDNGGLQFDTGNNAGGLNTNVMYMSNDGRVGINTTSPDEKLDITGGYLKFNGGDYGLKGSASLSYNATSDHYFQSGGSTTVIFKASGYVGIGTTSPSSYNSHGRNLVVNSTGNTGISIISGQSSSGSLLFGDGTGGTAAYRGKIEYDHSNDQFEIRTAATVNGLFNSGGTLTVAGDLVAYGSPSDKRLKENIKPIKSALDKVSKLQGVTFNWKESGSILELKEDVGFIAQDVQKVIPELVRENKDGMLSMRHQGIAPILLEAIKELKAEIEELKKQIK